MSQPKVLIVEDDSALCEALAETLKISGYSVLTAANGQLALDIVRQGGVGLVVSDVQMEPVDGIGLLKQIKATHPEIPVMLMTAYGTIQKAVDAMHSGAADYLVKPFEADVLLSRVNRLMPSEIIHEYGLVAEDPLSRDLVALASRVAATQATVMISGESGTGKEVFARYIHSQSERRSGPFVAINCAAIPDNMLEAVLFGYEKGAFTGAYQSCAGKFEQAQGGTLLLDEISEMDLSLQAKLLRVLQEREVERLGGRKMIPLDVRVLATTNRNLREEVAAGRFREDLFYRLHVFPLHLPPLRERTRDIMPLTRQVLCRYARGGIAPEITAAAEQCLLSYSWPGNIRELDNVIQRALILHHGNEITADDIRLEPTASMENAASEKAHESEIPGSDLEGDLRLREQRLILEALQSGNGNRRAAAKRLGISERTLRYKLARMREEGINIPGGFGVKCA